MNDGNQPAGPPLVPDGQVLPPPQQQQMQRQQPPQQPLQQPPPQQLLQQQPQQPPQQQNQRLQQQQAPHLGLQPPQQQPPPQVLPPPQHGVQFHPHVQFAPPMGQPLPPPQQAAPTTCRNYAELYADASKDPFRGHYDAPMSEFEVPVQGQARYGEANLSSRVANASLRDMPYGVLILVKPATAPASDPGRLIPVHRVTRMPITLVGNDNHWDDQIFGILDDVIGQAFTVVPLETRWFQRIQGTTTVPTDAHLDQLLAGQPDDQFVGPFAANDANTEQVGTRHCMFVPFQFMPIFIGTRLTPRQAWLRATAFARANNIVDMCRPLLNFLKVALTSSAPNVASVIAHAYPMLAQPQDHILVSFFKTMVERDLPQWNPTVSTQHASAQLIAQSISGLTEEQRLMRHAEQQKQAQREAGGTPQQLFGDAGLRKLMRLCQVTDAAFLPPIYFELARVARSHRHGEIQAAIFNTKELLNVQHDVIISPALTDKILSLQWSSPDPDDMEYAINPALMGQATPDEERHLLETIRLRDWMQLGIASPSVADVRDIITPATVRFPRDMLALQYAVTSFWVLLHVFLGPQHPITTVFYTATQDIAQHIHDYEFNMESDLPTHVIRYYQRTLDFWAAAQVKRDDAVPWPGVSPIAQFAMGQRHWSIPIPARYRRAAPPPSPVGPPPPTKPGIPNPPAAPVDKAKQDTMVRRDKPVDPRFQEIAARNLPPKVVKKRLYANKLEFPKDSNGIDRCFNWNIQGFCNTRCTQAADHHTRHSEADQASLLEWLRQHYKAE